MDDIAQWIASTLMIASAAAKGDDDNFSFGLGRGGKRERRGMEERAAES